MLISGKGKYFSVFGCISKNFPENIFWCLEKKKENTNPRKISSTIAISRSMARVHDGAISRRRSRSEARAHDSASSRRRDLAIAILRCRSRDRATWSSDWRSSPPEARTRDRRRLEINWLFGFFSSLARARSLSLSLSFSGNALKWKWWEKIISGSKVKILVNRKSFSGKYHFPWQSNMRKRVKMISWNHFHPKQTHPKISKLSSSNAKNKEHLFFLIY